MTALFERDGMQFVPQPVARGPWDPTALHGGPVGALIARAAEQHPAEQPMMVTRLTIELLRPVPVEPLAVVSELTRPGRKVQLVAVRVSAGEREVARGVGLRIRRQSVAVPAHFRGVAPPPMPEVATEQPSSGWAAFHNTGVEMRYAAGGFSEPGPATAWIRLRQPVVAGEEVSAIQRVAACADFGNGISGVLPFERYRFINPDLTISVQRAAEGEWICLDAVTLLSDDGIALSACTLFDRRGELGRSQQSVIVEER